MVRQQEKIDSDDERREINITRVDVRPYRALESLSNQGSEDDSCMS